MYNFPSGSVEFHLRIFDANLKNFGQFSHGFIFCIVSTNGCIVRNLKNPGRKTTVAFKRIEFLKHLHENILRQFFCILSTGYNRTNQGENRTLMLAKQLFEGFLGVYKLFELFVKRRERIMMIEKMIDTHNAIPSENALNIPSVRYSPFGTLRIACLLLGIGMGLLIGFFILMKYYPTLHNAAAHYTQWSFNGVQEIVYGSGTLLFGGLGLLLSYLIEMKHFKKTER